ncbi:hypothetical protein [Agrobacterium tumefaciens]|jgi:hypothetical protein|uniref:hypothetical protein n=1 Tax=Agrobacterium tumefaciens TaxID=358 RepID=UPI002FDC53C4
MTVTNSLIAELVRDANRLDHLDGDQKRRMLERAVTTIRDMRETIGILPGPAVTASSRSKPLPSRSSSGGAAKHGLPNLTRFSIGKIEP